jgi:uncharacterized membrane protein (DUF373 family)
VGEGMSEEKYSGLSMEEEDTLIRYLHRAIRYGVKALAVLMVLVILFGVGDVVWLLFQRLSTPPLFILKLGDILYIFGAFLAVLIAIEIFINITLYLRDDIIHVRLVVATALMAIARKVIVFDFKEVSFHYVYAAAAVVLALGITYWLIPKKALCKSD